MRARIPFIAMTLGVVSASVGAALVTTAGAAAAAPAVRESIDITGDTFDCQAHDYVVVSGTYDKVAQFGSAEPVHLSISLTPRDVVLADETGTLYRLTGSIHVGVAGGGDVVQQNRTIRLNILGDTGSVVDRVARTQHLSFHDDVLTQSFLHEERSTCEVPTLYL